MAEYKACTDPACSWEASGTATDIERLYKRHRKQHPAAKAQESENVVSGNPAKPGK